jgi:hypothetical protein
MAGGIVVFFFEDLRYSDSTFSLENMADQKGKVVIVTGSNTGKSS